MELKHSIREATSGDAKGLKNCMLSAYAAHQARMEGTHLPPLDTDYQSEIKRYPTWVVEAAGSIIGGLIMVFQSSHATIANIAVDPAYQGRGIGGELMRYAEAKAKTMGLSELRLTTHVLLDENISLYRHLDWVETHRDERRVFMKKRL